MLNNSSIRGQMREDTKGNDIRGNDIIKNNTTTIPLRKIRCAIYTRKSSEEGLDLEYNSLANQYDSCKKYIQSQQHEGWVLVTNDGNISNGNNSKRYDDGGYSGGNLERPALRELIKDIQLGLIDMVVVYKIDRLSRSLMDFSKLVDVFERYNVSFISVTQNFNTNDSMGKLMLNILLSFAQFEREMTGDRIRDKIRMQRSKGMWTGGTVPLGYDNIDKKLIINEEESKRINLIFDTFIKTESISETLKVLNNPDDPLNTLKETIKTKFYESKSGNIFGNTNFNRGSLHKLLKNKIYIGLTENRNTNDLYEGQHEAIIDKETYNKVQEIFEKHLNDKIYDNKIINTNNHAKNNINGSINGSLNNHAKNYISNSSNNNSNNSLKETKTIHTPKLDSKVPYLLKGLMRCECCNSILTPTYTTKKNGVVYRYYKPSKLMKHVKINNADDNGNSNYGNSNSNYGNGNGNYGNGNSNYSNGNSNCGNSNYSNNRECQLTSIPAEQIENIVLNQIYRIIRTPTMIQKIIDDVMEKQKQINKEQTDDNVINLSEQDIINHLKNIESVWDELFPREQMEIVNILIKGIIVSRTNIKIIFNNNGFIQLLREASGINPMFNNVSNSSDIISELTIVNIPIDLTHKTGRSFIATPDGGAIVIENTNSKRIAHSNYVDNAVLKELIQAEEWKEELNNNPNININTIAKRECKQNSYICRILDLVFLAPDIKKAILTNNAPVGLSLKEISKIINKSWDEQRRLLKVESKVI
jgi:DNA invertase Pin-like site-specific DNA recombinase